MTTPTPTPYRLPEGEDLYTLRVLRVLPDVERSQWKARLVNSPELHLVGWFASYADSHVVVARRKPRMATIEVDVLRRWSESCDAIWTAGTPAQALYTAALAAIAAAEADQ